MILFTSGRQTEKEGNREKDSDSERKRKLECVCERVKKWPM